jgi:hypothetical protein
MLATLALSALVLAAPAQGAITRSHVTRPKDPRYLVYNKDVPNTFAVRGTTSGGNPASDKVDLLCYYGATSKTVASSVPLASDGSFSVPNADLSKIDATLCRLRAVPAGTTPTNLAPFRGPLVGVDHRQSYVIATGPNTGKIREFYVWAGQRSGAFDYDSLTGCGIDDSYLIDRSLNQTALVFYCNAWFWWYENFDSKLASTRSEIRVDGADAYGGDAANNINHDAPGLPAVRYSIRVNPITGRLVLHESEALVKCPDSTYPPTATTCPSFIPTGVRVKRTIVQDHAGRLARIIDVFKTTNRRSHRLDLLWQNDQRLQPYGGGGTSTTVAYHFPGHGGFSTHVPGDVIHLPKRAPAAILIKQQGSPSGDTSTGRGAIVYARRASDATFNEVDSIASDFYLHQRARIPRRGRTTIRFAYAQTYTQKQLRSLVRFALRHLSR